MFSLEAIQAIAAQSPSLAFAIAMLLLLNRNHIDSLRERKEWLAELLRIMDRYDERMEAATIAITESRAEIHNIRTRFTEFILPIQAFLEGQKKARKGDTSD